MAIVPISSGMVQYARPVLPMPYYTSYYPMLYSHAYRYPTICPGQVAYLAAPSNTMQYARLEEDNVYRYMNATYNPGNYWIWPPGQ